MTPDGKNRPGSADNANPPGAADDANPPVYTRTGDDGTTGRLFGGRVSKADPLVDVYGTLDEAVAALGLARAAIADAELSGMILGLQRGLFVAGADLAANPRSRDRLRPGVSLVTAEMIARLETEIDHLVEEQPLGTAFVVPGANPGSAALDLARGILRRAERRLVGVIDAGGAVSGEVLAYLNRASDLVYVMARYAAGPGEPLSHD